MKIILNLTQHSATAEQTKEGVVELGTEEKAKLTNLLTFKEPPTREEMRKRGDEVAQLAVNFLSKHYSHVPLIHRHAMIGGAPFFMAILELALGKMCIQPVYAFSQRESKEQIQEDGSIIKTQIFKHLGFVKGIQSRL